MADDSKIPLLPSTTDSGWQTAGTLVAPTTQRRDSTAISRSEALPERSGLEQATVEVRLAMEEAAVAATQAAQRALTFVNVLKEALAILEQAAGSAAAGPPALASLSVEERSPFSPESSPPLGSDASLSPREREVLALVAKGQTNKAIANALYVSPNTVKTHVTSLLHKLQADNRVQLAAIATEQEWPGTTSAAATVQLRPRGRP